MTVLIGGTRGTGLLVAQRLHDQGASVRVLARNPAEAAARLPVGMSVVAGDITHAQSLPAALEGANHVVLTAGVRSGHPASEARIKATEYDGVLNVLAALRALAFAGRFVYMTSSGVGVPSLAACLLNLYKGNTLKWRRCSEGHIRNSDVDYVVIRAGVLLNRTGGERRIIVTQRDLPLSWRFRIARADVADAIVASLTHPCTSRVTYDVVWGDGGPRGDWQQLLSEVRRDPLPAATSV